MTDSYRIAVLADIHGNLAALDAILADLERDRPLDGILAAGDLIVGPDQSAVLQRLAGLRAVLIQGNNEHAISRMAAGAAPDYVYTARQFALRRWALEQLTPAELALVRALPEQAVFHLPGADPIRVAHGTPRNINELLLPAACRGHYQKYFMVFNEQAPPLTQLDEIFDRLAEPVLVVGHSHLPWCERRGAKLAMNPGAANFPMDGFIGAQYALLSWDGRRWTPELRAIPYDLQAFRRSSEASGVLESGVLAKIFLKEALEGRDISFDFFRLARELRQQAGLGHLHYIPDEIWEQAGAEFL